jgi:hypothetical protein
MTEEGPTQHMPPPPSSPPPGYGGGNYGYMWQGARMPVPGNAEWLLWFIVEIVFAIIWAASDEVGANEFLIVSAVITLGYLISRGIAKAGKVLEQ